MGAGKGTRTVDVAVIGAGFGGIAAGAQLKRNGFHDFAILEKHGEVGGTWWENTYPGCACDVPSHLYSLSSHLNPDWSDTFASQPEILQYLKDSARALGITPHIRFRCEVEDARWNDEASLWELETSRGPLRARFLVSASGPFAEPSVPKIDGIADYRGKTFHSSRWDHDYDLAGKRVAVVGTGASAIQFVPEIRRRAARVTVFQRTAPWIMPRGSRPMRGWEKALLRAVPGANRLRRTALYWGRESWAVGFLNPSVMRRAQRLSHLHLRRQVRDPETRRRLTPDYTMGCKRVLLSNDYWRAFNHDDTELVTSPLRHMDADSLTTADGVRHEADAVIWGTGFHVTDPPVAHLITGRGGRTLAERWTPTMSAYKSTTVPGFPNLFMLLGPNSALGHNSVVLMIEAQLKQVMKVLKHMRRTGSRSIEPTEAALDDYRASVGRRMKGTVWVAGGCDSWYLDSAKNPSTVWPGFVPQFWAAQSRLRLDHYTVR
ncbi:flavin-containing monooxygenase [Salininema proteolyticum]|uniref:Flavin-containing monooxygenase n=1 Tax=Salininema proteolyticum TaxID=1607685 RepID=A0ABV8U5H2_9ACTN